MIVYRNRELDVKQSLIDDFGKHRGYPLDVSDLDGYVEAAYGKVSDEPLAYSDTVPKEELALVFEKMLDRDIFMYS